MHSPRTMTHSSHTSFWRTQLTIIEECRRRPGLHAIIFHIHEGSQKRLVGIFSKTLHDNGWLLTDITTNFPEFGDSIDSSAKFMLGIHSNTQQAPSALRFQLPPPVKPLSISRFLIEDFNKAPWAVSWAKDSPLFIDDTNLFRAVEPIKIGKSFLSCLYHLAKKMTIQTSCAALEFTALTVWHPP